MTIQLHEGQSTVFEDMFVHQKARYMPVCCSRGWGKSYFAGTAALAAAFELMELPAYIQNKNVGIIAPTYDQVTDIYFPLMMYELGLEHYAVRSSKEHGRIILPGNVEIRLLSYEAIERLRGKGFYFIVWDEISSCNKGMHPKDAWESIVEPCISTRWSPKRAKQLGAKSPGRAVFPSTPKGFNFFYDLYNFQEIDPEWKSYHFDYHQSPFLDPVEIEKIRHRIDPIQFASEYLASFQDSGNNVFYCFDRKTHVRNDLEYFRPPSSPNVRDGEDVHINIDFNVGLQCSTAFAVRGKQIHILDEFKGHPDTETLAIALATKYKGHKIYAYPDPSGRSRKTSAPVGRTDFSILESHRITCLAPKAAPPIVDSVNAVNRMLKTAAGDVNMYVSAKCTGAITSMERTKWVDKNPDTATIDKKEGVEHFSDGIRYGTSYLFPVENGTKRVSRGFTF